MRGHLAEFGVIAPQGLRNVGKLIDIVRDEGDASRPSGEWNDDDYDELAEASSSVAS
jgi:hypothetical protein